MRDKHRVPAVPPELVSEKLQRHYQKLVGQKFGRLTVVCFAGLFGKAQGPKYICTCDCSGTNTSMPYAGDLKSGKHKSCGCLTREKTAERNVQNATHRLSGSPLHTSWSSMMERCGSKKAFKWYAYGARGITPCAYIKADPRNLLQLIGERPPGMSLDRINNNGRYTCGSCDECKASGDPMNVRWATAKQQGRNKSDNHLVSINGQTKTIAEWAEISGLFRLTIAYRVKMKWPDHRILEPARKCSNQYQPK